MKGPFSIWAFFGLTLWIDLITLAIFYVAKKKLGRIDPYSPLRSVSVVIPVHKESENYVEQTVRGIYSERYPVKNVIVCGDSDSKDARSAVKRLAKEFPNLYYYKCPEKSKAKKINYVTTYWKDLVGEFIYVRDCRVKGEVDCIEKMVSHFNNEQVGAVTSYGRVSVPKNFGSRSYFWGKAWINEIGRFRKRAQEKRRAVFVVCGASTMYRSEVLRKIPMPSGSKTEDTHYTWVLQLNNYIIRVADDAMVSAPEVDGENWQGIKAQIKQSYRWSSGTVQCIYREGPRLTSNKKLLWTTIAPGFLESLMYTAGLLLLPLSLIYFTSYGIGFLIGDTVFSLIGTLIILPDKFLRTLAHYPQVFFFKYVNALVFMGALITVTYQAATSQTEKWSNEWVPPETQY